MDRLPGQRPGPERRQTGCRVCGAPNAAALYCAIVCSACAAFFARTMRREGAERYKCPMQQPCPLEHTVRRRCRACRLKKCLDEGMRLKTKSYCSEPYQIQHVVPSSSARPSVIVRTADSHPSPSASQRPSVIVRRTQSREEPAGRKDDDPDVKRNGHGQPSRKCTCKGDTIPSFEAVAWNGVEFCGIV